MPGVIPVRSWISTGGSAEGWTKVSKVPSDLAAARLDGADLDDLAVAPRPRCRLEVDGAERHVAEWDLEIVEAALAGREQGTLGHRPTVANVCSMSSLDGVEGPGAGHAFELVLAAHFEADTRAGDEVDNGPRHPHLARVGR